VRRLRLALRLPSRSRARFHAVLRRGVRVTRSRGRGDRARRRSRARRSRDRRRRRRRRGSDDGPWLCRDRSRGRGDHRSVGRRHGASRIRGRRGLGGRNGLGGRGRPRGGRCEPAGRVVRRGHRRAAGRPPGRRTGERDQAGAHRERIASEPQRRRPPGHLRPPFRSLTVRRSTHACQYGRGWPPVARRPPCSHAPSASSSSSLPGLRGSTRRHAGRPTIPVRQPACSPSRGRTGFA